jgi:two-component system OmpR family response regulator
MLTDYLQEQHEGFTIKSFPTGEACLQSLDEHPDAVVLDYYLNSKEKNAANGIDILKEIKKQDKALPVIMLSSQKSYATAAQTINYGAVHYVIKGQDAFDEIFQLIKANV